MSLQQDPSKSFGSSSYFKNKDQQRQQVNAMRQSERQKRITTQLLRRNMKQAMRRGEDGGRFIQAAEAADLDIFGRTGFGEEASVAMERARYDVDQNFNAAQRAKSQRDARLGEAGAKPDGKVSPVTGGTTTPADGKTTSATGTVAIPEATTPPAVGPNKSVLKRPDWADDVKNDSTFRDVDFDDPGTLAKIQGKTRGEVYDMLRKAQAARLMAGFDDDGKTLALGEENILSQRKYAAEKAAEKEMKIKQGFENFAKDQEFAKTPGGVMFDNLQKAHDAERNAFVKNFYSKEPEYEKFQKYAKDPLSPPNSKYISNILDSRDKLVGKLDKIETDYKADTIKRKQATLDSQVLYKQFKKKWDAINSSPDAKKINEGYRTYKQERIAEEIMQKEIEAKKLKKEMEAKKLKKEMEAKEYRKLQEQITESYIY